MVRSSYYASYSPLLAWLQSPLGGRVETPGNIGRTSDRPGPRHGNSAATETNWLVTCPFMLAVVLSVAVVEVGGGHGAGAVVVAAVVA